MDLSTLPAKAFSFVAAHALPVVVAAVLVLGGGWFFFVRAPASTEQTMVVHAAPFIQQISVSGTVTAAQDVDLGFAQSGRIAALYVKVGQKVSAGAMLGQIENGELRAAILQKQAALETQEAKLAAQKAGTRPEQIAVTQSEIASDTTALQNAISDAYRAADAGVHNTLDQFFNNPRTNPQLTFSVSDTQIKANVEAERTSAETMLAAWQASLGGQGDLSAAVSLAQKNLSQVAALLSDANAALNHGLSSPSMPQATLDAYTAAVGTARSSINTSIAALASDAAALTTAQKNLALEEAGSTPEDIAAEEAQVKAAEADLASAQAGLQKTIITAPFGGVVTAVAPSVGSIVSPNTPAISLIGEGAFEVDSYVPEVNVALLSPGDPALVTLDAYGADVSFGAKVISIDPADTVREGVSTFKTVLQFAQQDERIKAGMTANVVITTLEKPSVLSVPVGVVTAKGGKKYVTVKAGQASVDREVTTGSTGSLGTIEILSGLSEGDVVVIRQ